MSRYVFFSFVLAITGEKSEISGVDSKGENFQLVNGPVELTYQSTGLLSSFMNGNYEIVVTQTIDEKKSSVSIALKNGGPRHFDFGNFVTRAAPEEDEASVTLSGTPLRSVLSRHKQPVERSCSYAGFCLDYATKLVIPCSGKKWILQQVTQVALAYSISIKDALTSNELGVINSETEYRDEPADLQDITDCRPWPSSS